MMAMPQSIDPVLLAVILVTFLIGGTLKGIMGFGLPLVAAPVLTLIIGLTDTLSIIAIPLAVTNAWQTWAFRSAWSTAPYLPRFLIVGLPGLALGTWLLALIPGAWLETLLGLLMLTYIGLRLANPGFVLGPARGLSMAPGMGFAAGLVHGATGLSSTVGSTYFHAMNVPRQAFILSNGLMFLLFAGLHMPMMAVAGVLRNDALFWGVLALIPAFGGIWIGNRIAARVNRQTFSVMVLSILTLVALPLLWSGISEIIGPF